MRGECLTDRFLEELATVLPRQRTLRRPAELAAYESDALTAFRQRPEAVLLAEAVPEVVAIVKLCHRHRVPFVARGSGTSLSGGSLPVAGGVVIALNRLDRILELDPVERVAVVEPGVVNSAITRAAAQHDLYYAPDPSSQTVCTIGGNVAFNSGGAHCLKYGMTSNHVLGLEVVLPDGEVVTLGSRSGEGTGPDLVGLFVGSEGLLGIATKVTVRLLRRPQAVFTLLAAFPSLRDAGDAVTAVVAAGLLPAAMEIMDELSLEAAEAAVGAGYPRCRALLIVELDGPETVVGAEAAALRRVIDGTDPLEVRIARDEASRAAVWRGRKGAFSAVGRLSSDYIVQDGVVPRSRLGEALEEIDRLAAKHGLRVANVFHAGDGNLHPLILYDGKTEGELERAEELAGRILERCIALGGSITGEHGVGMEKRDFLSAMFEPADVRQMRSLQRAVDERGVANPGKMFPPGEDATLAAAGS